MVAAHVVGMFAVLWGFVLLTSRLPVLARVEEVTMARRGFPLFEPQGRPERGKNVLDRSWQGSTSSTRANPRWSSGGEPGAVQ